ncbi:hypothetical protein [Nitrospirillum pindoramense]|uniref:Uncharacterized protein n=1 Tax=Nitrospirillum amazonense TaxID=28077 RepID=A0A560H6I9_9PROT|nr:hypothetical protein [Nitrospirillum amazonense]TWB41937.1 hypothetical protein FBZ90_107316 [Nitrospirillum amazonense]
MLDTAHTAEDAELDQALREGIHEVVRDATGHPADRMSFPVGRVPAGQTLEQFWHVDFPYAHWVGGGLDYSHFEVRALMTDMLSVRRLSPALLQALLTRIKDRLTAAFGPQQGGMMAAVLIARCQQAVTQPEDFPGLLSDDELIAVYRLDSGLAKDFGAFGGGAQTVNRAIDFRKKVAARAWLPRWIRRLAALAEVGKRAKPSVLGWSLTWAQTMMGVGYAHFSGRASACKDELNRRNLPIPQ